MFRPLIRGFTIKQPALASTNCCWCTVTLAPGAGGNQCSNSLPQGYEAYAPDLRGCGDTERPGYGHTIEVLAADLRSFAASIAVHSAHVIGHSLGCAVALQAALDQPDLVRSLTLIAPPPAEGRSVVRKGDTFSHWLAPLFDVNQDVSLVTLGATYRMLRHLGANRALLRRALMRLAPTRRYDRDFIELVSDAARMAPEAVVGHLQTLDEWNVASATAPRNAPDPRLGRRQGRPDFPRRPSRFY